MEFHNQSRKDIAYSFKFSLENQGGGGGEEGGRCAFAVLNSVLKYALDCRTQSVLSHRRPRLHLTLPPPLATRGSPFKTATTTSTTTTLQPPPPPPPPLAFLLPPPPSRRPHSHSPHPPSSSTPSSLCPQMSSPCRVCTPAVRTCGPRTRSTRRSCRRPSNPLSPTPPRSTLR